MEFGGSDSGELLCVLPVFQLLLHKENNTGTHLDMNLKKKLFFSISASKSNRRALFFLMISERMLWISECVFKHMILSVIWHSPISK